MLNTCEKAQGRNVFSNNFEHTQKKDTGVLELTYSQYTELEIAILNRLKSSVMKCPKIPYNW